jgi:hypothetical protein
VFVRRSTYLALQREQEKQNRHWERIQNDLLDRLMYVTGQPWMLPPTPQEEKVLTKEAYYLDGSNEVA